MVMVVFNSCSKLVSVGPHVMLVNTGREELQSIAFLAAIYGNCGMCKAKAQLGTSFSEPLVNV